MPTQRRSSKIHRVNGPYWPLGFLGGEYCVKCGQDWPCKPEQDKRAKDA